MLVRKAKKKILTQEHTQKEAWIYQSTVPCKITFDMLVKECSETCGETPNKTRGVTQAFIDRICHYLAMGHSVELEGIGTFKPAISSKAYDAKAEMEQPDKAIRDVKMRFYPHLPLQKAIAQNGYEYQPELDDADD